jgi:hypothetical protein
MPIENWQPVDLAVSLVWSFRALAAAAGTFVLLEWMGRAVRQPVEFPAYNRRLNARAWACVGAGCLLAWASYVLFNLYLILPQNALFPNVVLATTWALISAGIVQRATARAEQPKLIWISAALIVIGALVVLCLEGKPGL